MFSPMGGSASGGPSITINTSSSLVPTASPLSHCLLRMVRAFDAIALTWSTPNNSAAAAATAAATSHSPLPLLTNASTMAVPLTRAPSFIDSGSSSGSHGLGLDGNGAVSPHGSGYDMFPLGGHSSDGHTIKPLQAILRAPSSVDTTSSWRTAIDGELNYMTALVEVNAGYSQEGSLTGGGIRLSVEITAGGGLQASTVNVTAHDDHLLGTLRKDLAQYLCICLARLALIHRRPAKTSGDGITTPAINRTLTRYDNYRSLAQLSIHTDDVLQVVSLLSGPQLNLLPSDCLPLYVDCLYGIAMCASPLPYWSPAMPSSEHHRLAGMQALSLLPSMNQWSTSIHRLIMQHPLRNRLLTNPPPVPYAPVIPDEKVIQSTITTLPAGAYVTYSGLTSAEIAALAPQALAISCIASAAGSSSGGLTTSGASSSTGGSGSSSYHYGNGSGNGNGSSASSNSNGVMTNGLLSSSSSTSSTYTTWSDPSALGRLSQLPWPLAIMCAALLDARSLSSLHVSHRQFSAADRLGGLWLALLSRDYPRALRDLPFRDRALGEMAFRRCYAYHARNGAVSCQYCTHIMLPSPSTPLPSPSVVQRCESCRQ
jgi:uncharacterized membrane protein YgcG